MRNGDIVTRAIAYLHTRENGARITTFQLLEHIGQNDLATGNLLALDLAIKKAARDSGLIMDDSGDEDLDVGLPFHIPFTVKGKTGE